MKVSSLLVLVPLSCFGQTQENLCFRIDFDKDLALDQFKQLAVVRPVKGFPGAHAKVVNGYCGGAVAGDPIPTGKIGCTDCK